MAIDPQIPLQARTTVQPLNPLDTLQAVMSMRNEEAYRQAQREAAQARAAEADVQRQRVGLMQQEAERKAQQDAQLNALLPQVLSGKADPSALLAIAGDRGKAILDGITAYDELSRKRMTDARDTARRLTAGLKALPPEMRSGFWPNVRAAAMAAGFGNEELVPAEYSDQYLGAVEQWANEPAKGAAANPFTLTPGAKRFDASGKEIASVPAPEKTGGLQRVETVDAQGNPVTQFVTPESGATYPKAAGAKAGAKRVWVSRNGKPIYVTEDKVTAGDVPYSPTGKGGDQAALAQEFTTERRTRMRDTINDLLPKVSNLTVGLGGSIVNRVPGTPAANFEAEVESLKANIAFSELQEMRNASKTGGALGQVSDMENRLLSSALGALSVRQSPDAFRTSLKKILGSLDRWDAAKAKLGGKGSPEKQRFEQMLRTLAEQVNAETDPAKKTELQARGRALLAKYDALK